jgi:sterol desaturase/sphingolipid hydroxylase (fatty acid hydroxylase superfamily)
VIQPTDDAPRSPDLARPLLGQIGVMGERYDAWVHDSIGPRQAEALNRARIEAGDRVARRWPSSLRLFENRALEALSHIYWWQIPLIWGPIIAALFLLAVKAQGVALASALGWAAFGFLLWTFEEYLLHRFFFHYRPRSALGRKVHFLAHGIHHLDPWDRTRLVFPPLGGIVIAAGLFLVLLAFLPLGPALAAMAGLLVGYVTYDMTHYFTHHARPRSRWGKFLKTWHLAHHHKHWRRMYGVSSPLWDFVLRTGRPKRG